MSHFHAGSLQCLSLALWVYPPFWRNVPGVSPLPAIPLLERSLLPSALSCLGSLALLTTFSAAAPRVSKELFLGF